MTICPVERIFTHGVFDGDIILKPWRTSIKVVATEKKNFPSDFTTSYADLTMEGVAGITNGQTILFDFPKNYDTNEKFFTFWGEQLFTMRMARNPASFLEDGLMVEEAGEQPLKYMVFGTGAGTTYYDKGLKYPINLKTNLFSSFLSTESTNTQTELITEVISGVATEPIREMGVANDEILIGRVSPIIPLDIKNGKRISMIISGGML